MYSMDLLHGHFTHVFIDEVSVRINQLPPSGSSANILFKAIESFAVIYCFRPDRQLNPKQ